MTWFSPINLIILIVAVELKNKVNLTEMQLTATYRSVLYLHDSNVKVKQPLRISPLYQE